MDENTQVRLWSAHNVYCTVININKTRMPVIAASSLTVEVSRHQRRFRALPVKEEA